MVENAFVKRLTSVDVLRGITIAFMILVNDPGSSHAYAPLKHADWNGFTPTDLVFPTFLFVVGISTVLSLSGRMARGASRRALFLGVLRRAVLIYVLGLLVNSFPFTNLATVRFVGVLPRIALCYLVVGSLYLWNQGWRDKVFWLAVALVGYWALLRFVPVPGYGVPTHDVPLLDKDGNLAAWLDRWMFPAQRLYEKTRDPEGLLSTIPAVGTALLGVLTGMWLKTARSLREKIAGIVVAGLLCVAAGWVWNFAFPINKKMWTSSYVLFAGGLSMLLLAVAMAAVDLPKWCAETRDRVWMPALVFGTNAITAYVLSELLAGGVYAIHLAPGYSLHHWMWDRIYPAVPDAAFASLVYSLAYVAFCWGVVWMLWRKRIFLRV
jgi:predicted acyltransferase